MPIRSFLVRKPTDVFKGYIGATYLVLMLFVIYLNTDYGFEIPDLFVVGYALDYNEYFRDLNVSFFFFKKKTLFYGVLETVIYLIPGV